MRVFSLTCLYSETEAALTPGDKVAFRVGFKEDSGLDEEVL